VKGAEVTLRGSVGTREEKRYAEDLVERVMGVRDVNNHLKVTRPDQVSPPPPLQPQPKG
jgi:osmotically-inducible protein OsmY